jgi:8-oxo-dGTP pyrophosphatase MutT (NUDIX family)
VTEPAIPEWLRELAVAARTMTIPEALVPPATGGRDAAVLVLFGEGDNGPDLLFIQRSDDLRLHAGQPAFPGGGIDPEDGGPVQAALREATEEVGIDPSGVQVVGALPEVYLYRTGFRVVPVLAWWQRPSAVAPVDPAEVASVERVSVAELADPAVRVTVRLPIGRIGPGFQVKGMLIWGFTAALVDRLLALGGWEKPWDPDRIVDL